MPRDQRNSPQGAHRSHDWLRLGSARPRPWAYEELLFGSGAEPSENQSLTSFEAVLAIDLAELRQMQNELHEQVVRIAALQGRVEAMKRLGDDHVERAERTTPGSEARSGRSDPPDPPLAPRTAERIPSLARSEGFRVDSPSGFVGFVEGLRFISRIDQPDLLEVRSGRFGRGVMLIPIEAVEEVVPAEQRLVIRTSPPPRADHVQELVGRLRRVMSASHLVR
jgi:hypothetical protein